MGTTNVASEDGSAKAKLRIVCFSDGLGLGLKFSNCLLRGQLYASLYVGNTYCNWPEDFFLHNRGIFRDVRKGSVRNEVST